MSLFTLVSSHAPFDGSISYVLLVRTKKVVSRVTARGIVAFMADLKARRNRAIAELVGHAMGQFTEALPGEHAVSSVGKTSCPRPTSVRSTTFINPRPKSADCFFDGDAPTVAADEGGTVSRTT